MFRLVSEPDHVMQLLKQQLANLQLHIQELSRSSPAVYHSIQGFDTQIVCFNTDLPYLLLPNTCKLFLFGAGSILDAHGANEFVRADDLHAAVRSYQQIIDSVLLEAI